MAGMTQRTRTIPILVAALLAALAAGVLAVVPGSGSSHREAPLTSIDPTGDDTDLYAFTAPDATSRAISAPLPAPPACTMTRFPTTRGDVATP